jgi:hypothetical protein
MPTPRSEKDWTVGLADVVFETLIFKFGYSPWTSLAGIMHHVHSLYSGYTAHMAGAAE